MKAGSVAGGPISVDKCQTFQKMMGDNGGKSGSDFNKVVKLFRAVEKMFKCTGICAGDYKYFFFDINNGPPTSVTDGCFIALRAMLDALA